MLSFQNQQQAALELPGLTVGAVPDQERAAKFDLQLTLVPAPSGDLEALLTYATDLFDESTVAMLGQRFVRILEAVATDARAVVGDIDIVSDAERAQLRSAATVGRSANVESDAVVVPSGSTLPQILSAVVEADPEAPAISDDGEEITYGDLDEQSSRLARLLIGEGVGPGHQVPIVLPRSADAVVAAWAVLKSGAALTPIDAADADRMPSGMPAKVGITTSAHVDALPDSSDGMEWVVLDGDADRIRIDEQSGRPVTYTERIRRLGSEDPAFVAADGSFSLTHGNVVAFAERDRARYDITYESRTACTEPLSSVWSAIELIIASTAGAVTVVTALPDGNVTDLLADEWVTHAFVSAACAQALDVEELEDLEVLVLTDGALPEERPEVRRVVADAEAWSA